MRHLTPGFMILREAVVRAAGARLGGDVVKCLSGRLAQLQSYLSGTGPPNSQCWPSLYKQDDLGLSIQTYTFPKAAVFLPLCAASWLVYE